MAGKPGQGSKYTKAKAKLICEALAKGEPMTRICRRVGIGYRTVNDWQRQHAEFAADIARARLDGYDAIADETMEIADDARNDYMAALGDDGEAGGYKLNGEHIQRSKLRIETRLKLLAKWDPKRYGDKVTTELTGPNGGAVQVERVERVIVDPSDSDS